tara:strand:+ start:5737 stop:8049 length:2313 start_codon:yes stop_codon:yes gene_type:complete
MGIFPRQKLSSAEKKKEVKETGKPWGVSSLNYLIDQTSVTNREEILRDYRLLDGILDNADYDYVLNPLNTTIDRYKKFGAKLRNFDIISPVIKLYAGEFSKRFKNSQVLTTNDEDENSYKEGLNKILDSYYQQKIINDLNEAGLLTGQESQDQELIQEQVNKYNGSFEDTRVISGQAILDYIYYSKDVEDLHQEAYINWCISGQTYSYKGIFHNDIVYENVNPWEITSPEDSSLNIEDRAWAVRRQVMPINAILDRWHDKLTEEQCEWLESKRDEQGDTSSSSSFVVLPTQWISTDDTLGQSPILENVHGVEVYHAQWRGWKKVGILLTPNEIGQLIETQVDDTYKLNKEAGDVSIEWHWESEVNEGWRIGEQQDSIYLDIRPLEYNRMDLNNNSAQKLSYNGRINKNSIGKPQGIVRLGRPYQIIYNILHYQFEKVINKNKDKIMLMPQGLIPKGVGGWDEEKFMYHANANSFAVVDETAPNAGLALQGIKVLDMSLGAFAKDSIQLMAAVKDEWWESIGMNRQRYGDSMASDGKGVTEQAIFRSAIISEELNRKFEKFQEKDYEGLLDISKLAFIEGKKGKYINSDGREAFLKINPDNAISHLENNYGIFVRNSRIENENLETAKQYAFNLGQNGNSIDMLEIIGSTNFTKTKSIVKKMEENRKAAEEQMQRDQMASSEKITEMTESGKESDREVKRYIADKDYEKAIDVKQMEIDNTIEPENNSNDDNDDDGVDDETKRMNNHKISKENREVAIKERLAKQRQNTNK